MTSETEQLRAHLTTLQDELQHKFKSAYRADAEIETLRVILGNLVACVQDDLQRLPEGYQAREALERALRILKEQVR